MRIAITALVALAIAGAASLALYARRAAAPPGPFRVVSESAGELHFESTLPPYEITDVKLPDGGTYQRIKVEGGLIGGEPGEPDLPTLSYSISLKPGEEPSLTVGEVEWKTIPGKFRISPVQKAPTDAAAPPTKDTAAKGSSGSPILLGPKQVIMREHSVGVTYRPFHWNAATGELRAATRVEWTLRK